LKTIEIGFETDEDLNLKLMCFPKNKLETGPSLFGDRGRFGHYLGRRK
jgi:hypothetical protein